MTHQPITTLAELDALDKAELADGYCSTKPGDPEPGNNHSRSYHHGWRIRMMDLGEMPIPEAHMQLLRKWVAWERAKREDARCLTRC